MPAVAGAQRGALTEAARFGLWAACDVYLDTALRAGLDLMPLEYVVVRWVLQELSESGDGDRGEGDASGANANAKANAKANARPVPGVIVVSEFSTIAVILNGALRANPWDGATCVTTLDKALSMDTGEQFARLARDAPYVDQRGTARWTRSVLDDFTATLDVGGARADESVSLEPVPSAIEGSAMGASGASATTGIREHSHGVPRPTRHQAGLAR